MIAILAFSLTLLASDAQPPTPAPAAEDEPFVLEFVVGDYVVVGRGPDGGAAYAGSARIEKRGRELRLLRKVGGESSVAVGVHDFASPGEGEVLRFRWTVSERGEREERSMTCLVGSDLDNFARLTCYWTRVGTQPDEPGLEALFGTGAWPDEAPNRTFKP